MTYAEVILPLAFGNNLTYILPDELASKAGIGYRVVVPLGGRNKFYTGIITSISTVRPEGNYELKEAVALLDDGPMAIHPQIKLWNWIADYYLCHVGEVYKAALPAGLKIESETFVEKNGDFEMTADCAFNERQLVVLSLISTKGKMSVAEIQKATGFKNTTGIVTSLIDRKAVSISERLQERYHTKRESYITFQPPVSGEEIEELYGKVKGAKAQEKLLLYLINLSNRREARSAPVEMPRKELLAQSEATPGVLDSLIKKNIVTQSKKEINRFRFDGAVSRGLPSLSAQQTAALGEINGKFGKWPVVLFRGVTSSGKTEIYQHLIDDTLKKGGQALLLVPEIALTAQLTKRMQAVFGDKVLIYHSKFSDSERVDIWRKMLRKKKPCVVIGARSSVFLPFTDLKLVIVDEEHESSYKQSDPAPRYNARDVAIVLASMHGARTLLGSATPSIESYWKATNGKYGLVELLTRYRDTPLPPIEIVDMTQAHKSKAVAGGFALKTLKYLQEGFNAGKQSIVFQNRRGFAPVARCKACAWSPKCDRCDVALTYHKHIDSLVCHYCGNVYRLPKVCPQCGEPAIEIAGYGTERIEEEISLRMPDARISRLDLDTTRNKDSYAHIIEEFSAHDSDILVGTQMVSKGLDFGDVSSVVVVNADSIINFPDFRANERAFNMLEQVAGRAGRRDDDEKSRVVIQTYNPAVRLFEFLRSHDYRAFYDYEIEERRKYTYPPFSRIINIYLKHRDREVLNRLSVKYAGILRESLGARVFGPEEPLVGKVQNLYINRIMLKIESDTSLKKIKDYLKEVYVYMCSSGEMKNSIIYYDVDPV